MDKDALQGLSRIRQAACYQRYGRANDGTNDQEAVRIYELALKTLAGSKIAVKSDFNAELESIRQTEKVYGQIRDVEASPLYSVPLAEEIEEIEPDPLRLGVALLIDIGNAYFRQLQLELALGRYEAALKMMKDDRPSSVRGYAQANIGETLRRQGRLQEAKGNLEAGVRDIEKYDGPIGTRSALTSLAKVYLDLGKSAKSFAIARRALTLYSKADDRIGSCIPRLLLGSLHLRRRQFQEALATLEFVDGFCQTYEVNAKLHEMLAQANIALRRFEAARRHLESGLGAVGMMELNLRTDQGNVTLAESSQTLSDQLVSVNLALATKDPLAIRRALRAAEHSRARAFGMFTRPPVCLKEMPVDRAGLPITSSVFQGDCSQEAPCTKIETKLFRTTTSSDPRCEVSRIVEETSPPNLTRIVYHILDDTTLIFVVGRTGDVHVHVSQVGRRALSEMVNSFRRSLLPAPASATLDESDGLPTGNYRTMAKLLFTNLFAPILPKLAVGETLVIEPHGVLWQVPFAALEDEIGEPLIERWPVVYAHSSSVLDGIRSEPAFRFPEDAKVLVVANPDQFRQSSANRDDHGSLQGAVDEAKFIKELLPLGQVATRIGRQETLLSDIENLLPDYTVIHFASHGTVDRENPQGSYILLANGERLTARRIFQLNLRSDLVTLSACDSGLGMVTGDGVIGLSRAFLARGSRAVIASLWVVNDPETPQLMQSFYSRYLKSKEDKARSLQQAMIEHRKNPRTRHPSYWASFVLIGSER